MFSSKDICSMQLVVSYCLTYLFQCAQFQEICFKCKLKLSTISVYNTEIPIQNIPDVRSMWRKQENMFGTYIQGVPGGMCQTSGECSLG